MTPDCLSVGALNVFLRQKGQMVTDTSVWSLTGNQGNRWIQAKVDIHPTAAFQVQTRLVPASRCRLGVT